MADSRKICVVTGSRAEYGLLRWILEDIEKSPRLELQLVVTGAHLSSEFGLTFRAIESDGFEIAERVEMLLSSDTAIGVTKSMGLGLIGFADCFQRLLPDIVLIVGDRFEMLVVAQAAMVANIPIAHVAGGDVTEGAIDDAIRHSITKMAHLHFPSNELSGARLVQMGEAPASVHVVGSPGIDNIRRLRLLSPPELEGELGIQFGESNLLVTFHPVTLAVDDVDELGELLDALARLPPSTKLFVTASNADVGGRNIWNRFREWSQERPNVHLWTSLGQLRYLSLMSHVSAVVGNSSSGLYEAPSFGIPTVNIGDRQRGRLAAKSVIQCEAECDQIGAAIEAAVRQPRQEINNPYGDGFSAQRIVTYLENLKDPRSLLRKRFHLIK